MNTDFRLELVRFPVRARKAGTLSQTRGCLSDDFLWNSEANPFYSFSKAQFFEGIGFCTILLTFLTVLAKTVN